MVVGHQLLDECREQPVFVGDRFCRSRDDQRGAGLIDQHRIDLVDHHEVVAALHNDIPRWGHIVVEVVEPQLRAGGVGDIGKIGVSACFRIHVGQHDPDTQSQKPVDASDFLCVAGRQIVVDRGDVYSPAAQRIQVGGQACHQRLSRAGRHFGDTP